MHAAGDTDSEMQVWVSAVINPQTFWDAGAVGANMLISCFGQTWEKLGQKINLYHKSLLYYGFHTEQRTVTCLVHTFIAGTTTDSRRVAEGPLQNYLLQSIHLAKLQFPELNEVADNELAQLAALRFMKSASLIGDVEFCRGMVAQMSSFGITEVASLIDFGVSHDNVLASLHNLITLKDKYAPSSPATVPRIAKPVLALPYKHRSRHERTVREAYLESVESIPETGCVLVRISFESEMNYSPGEHVVLLADQGDDVLFVFASVASINHDQKQLCIALRDGPWPPIVPLLPAMVGTTLQVDGGHGHLSLPLDAELKSHPNVVLIGAGTGIAPMKCIAEAMIHNQGRKQITVLYSWNKAKWPEPLFHDVFTSFAQDGQLNYHCVWTGDLKAQPGGCQLSNVLVWHHRIDLQVFSRRQFKRQLIC